MQLRARLFGIIVSCVVLTIPLLAIAHAGGPSLEAESPPYFIDIGYTSDPLEAEASTVFEFGLLDSATSEVAEYEHVWVRVAADDRALLATGVVRQEAGATTLLYTFPEAGEYTFEASFRDGGREIAAASFPITVVPGRKGEADDAIWLWLGAAILGSVAGFFAARLIRARQAV